MLTRLFELELKKKGSLKASKNKKTTSMISAIFTCFDITWFFIKKPNLQKRLSQSFNTFSLLSDIGRSERGPDKKATKCSMVEKGEEVKKYHFDSNSETL